MNEISMLTPQMLELPGTDSPEKKNSAGEEFTDALKEAFNKVNDMQEAADKATEQYLTGENDNLHEVMLTTEKAGLALQLTSEIRNKVVEAYQEMSRMQI